MSHAKDENERSSQLNVNPKFFILAESNLRMASRGLVYHTIILLGN